MSRHRVYLSLIKWNLAKSPTQSNVTFVVPLIFKRISRATLYISRCPNRPLVRFPPNLAIFDSCTYPASTLSEKLRRHDVHLQKNSRKPSDTTTPPAGNPPFCHKKGSAFLDRTRPIISSAPIMQIKNRTVRLGENVFSQYWPRFRPPWRQGTLFRRGPTVESLLNPVRPVFRPPHTRKTR